MTEIGELRISEDIRAELKKPLGRLIREKEVDEIKMICKNKKIISVGDVCTIKLIQIGLVPHLALFDLKSKRKRIGPEDEKILYTYFTNPLKYVNLAGTINRKLIDDASDLAKKGGGVLIEGEEDLTALVFIRVLLKNQVVIYGQPDEGLVIVEQEKEIKEKVEKWFL